MKKNARRILLCLALTVLLCVCCMLQLSAADITVYLDAKSGADGNGGLSPDSAFATMDAAIAAVSEGGTVVLVSDYTISEAYVLPAHTGEIVLTAKDGVKDYKAKLHFAVSNSSGTVFGLSGPLTFRDMTISMTNFVIFTANFHPLTFDTGLTVTNGTKWAFVVGGYQSPTSVDLPANLDSTLTFRSGNFYKVCGFSRSRGAGTMTYTGTSRITVDGATVGEIYGGSLVNHYAGNTDITVNDGMVSVVYTGGDVSRQLLGYAKVTVNGGTVGRLLVNNTVGDADVFLFGGKVGTAGVSYYNEASKKSAEKARSLKSMHCDTNLFGDSQIEQFKAQFDKFANLAKIYVRSGAIGDGLTAEAPVGTLSKGFELVREKGGIVYVLGAVAYGSAAEYKKAENPVRIVGMEGGEIVFPSGSAAFTGDVTFENIKLTCSGALRITVYNGTLTVGDGVSTPLSGLSLAGAGASSGITVRAGAIAEVIAGSGGDHTVSFLGGAIGTVKVTDGSAVTTAELVVSGGNIGTLSIGAKDVTEKLVLRLRGGNIGTVTLGALAAETLVDVETARITGITVAGKLANGVLMSSEETDAALLAKLRPYFAEQIDANLVYLADGASGDGTSAASPFGDLNSAIAALGGKDGTVVLCGNYTVDAAYTVSAHKGRVTITSYDYINDYRESGATLTLAAAISFGGETVIERLNILSAGGATLYAKGNKLTVGKEVGVTRTNENVSYPAIVGGHNTMLTSNTLELTVESGEWSNLRLGYNSTKLIADNLSHKLTVNGGIFHGYVALTSRGTTSGTVDATFNGGTFYTGIYAVYEEDAAAYDQHYDITVTVNGGDFHAFIAPAKSQNTVLHGSYTLYLNGGEFMHLTNIFGSETFLGDMTSRLYVGSALDLTAKETGTTSFQNPIRYNNADPNLLYHDGYYYYTCTGSTTIGIIKAANLADIKTAPAFTILEETGGMNLWSPEIWYFTEEDVGKENAGWYMFISFDDGTTANQRMHVVKCLDGDNLLGRWGDPVTGEVNKPRKIVFPDAPHVNVESLCGGMSVSRINGKTYITYIGEADRGTPDFHQTVNICDFENPWTILGVPTTVCVPTEEWEMGGYGQDKATGNWYPKVVEGAAAVYGEDGSYYLMYTGSGYWTVHYQLSYLRFKGGDPLDAKNWEKYGKPIFARSPEVNGCGHASYITDPFGTKWAAYHGYLGPDASDRRWSHFEPMTVDASGVTIGNGSGMPNALSTVYTVAANPMPVGEKIAAFTESDTSVSKFAPKRTYAGQFTDVTTDKWFYKFVKLAYEYALANGTSTTKFSPEGKFTVAQALTAAANIHTAYHGGAVRATASGEKWFDPYVEYCVQQGIITATQFANYDKNITRGEMATVFANILPSSEYAAVREGANPDVTSGMACYDAVLKLYRAGIVGGDAGTGNYRPNDEIVRSEACVIFTRIAVAAERAK